MQHLSPGWGDGDSRFSCTPSKCELSVQTLMTYIEWSQGRGELSTALNHLAEGLGSETGTLVRYRPKTGELRLVASFDKGRSPYRPRLTRSFSEAVLGTHLKDLKLGASLLKSDIANPDRLGHPSLDDWMQRRGFSEMALICLNREAQHLDILELYYRDFDRNLWREIEDWGTATLARIYANRRPGIITETLSRISTDSRRPQQVDGPILGANNAAGLTRSELRVCVLVSRGLNPKAVADEIGVSATTVRTHLRNIYSKTGLDCFHSLARQLVSRSEQDALYFGMSRKSA